MLTEAVQEKPVDYGPPDYDGLWKKGRNDSDLIVKVPMKNC